MRHDFRPEPRSLARRVDWTGAALIPFAVFRIVFGVSLFLEIVQLFPARRLVFGGDPLAESSSIHPAPLLLFWGLAVASFILGYHTRAAAIMNYSCAVVVLGFSIPSTGFSYHADCYYLAGSLAAILLPIGSALSVDALLLRRPIPRPAQPAAVQSALLILILGTAYFDAFGWKINSSMWRSGLGAWAPASIPGFTYWRLDALVNNDLLMRGSSYAALIFEVLFLVLAWFKRLRPVMILSVVLLHVGIAVLYPIPLFSLAVASFAFGLLPPVYVLKALRAIRARGRRYKVYYDAACPLRRGAVAVLSALDFRKGVRFLPVQRMSVHEPALTDTPAELLLGEMCGVDRQGRLHWGVDAYGHIFTAFGWLWPLGSVFRLRPVRGIGQYVYHRVAKGRKRDAPCAEEVCMVASSLKPPGAPRPSRSALVVGRAFAAFWIVSFLIILLRNPILAGHLSSSASALAARYESVVYPWTGAAAHDVFVDERLFQGYRYETRLLIRKGSETDGLPTREDGTSRVFGRIWCGLVVRKLHPRQSDEYVDRELRRLAADWARNNATLIDAKEAVILRRPIEVSLTRWKAGLIARNRQSAWVESRVLKLIPQR